VNDDSQGEESQLQAVNDDSQGEKSQLKERNDESQGEKSQLQDNTRDMTLENGIQFILGELSKK
jgi:hypothetical protein